VAQDMFLGVLRSLRDVMGLSGAIFVGDAGQRTLQCQEFLSAAPLPNREDLARTYQLTDPSLVSEVMRTRQAVYASSTASALSQGLEHFKIPGPFLGVPLVHDGTPQGVLVVWNESGQIKVGPDLTSLVAPFAAVLALALSRSAEAARRARFLRLVEGVVNRLQTATSFPRIAASLMAEIQDLGFDRARLYSYEEETQSFILLATVGTPQPERLQGLRISLSGNPYARDIANSLAKPVPRIYTTGSSLEPNSAALGKIDGLPWVAVPLVAFGRLCGQITADTATSRRPITEEATNSLGILGALAAQAIGGLSAKMNRPEEPLQRKESGPSASEKHVFISYVHENLAQVTRLADVLKASGIGVWLDRRSIYPGSRWKAAISRAIEEGDSFIAVFSQEYVLRKTTYMNEELQLAIEQLRLRPRHTEWFIPARIDSTEIPPLSISSHETIRDIQHVDLHLDWNAALDRIVTVIKRGHRS
jgi:hypothetical protein